MATMKDPNTLYSTLVKFEGNKSAAYTDQVGVSTIGIGYTKNSGIYQDSAGNWGVNPNGAGSVSAGQSMSLQQSLALLPQVSQQYIDGAARAVGQGTWDSLNAGQQNALVSFTYQHGAGSLNSYVDPQTDRTIAECVQQGDTAGVTRAMTDTNDPTLNAGGSYARQAQQAQMYASGNPVPPGAKNVGDIPALPAPADVAAAGYTTPAKDDYGNTYYTNKDGTSVQQDPDTGQWFKYNADGTPMAADSSKPVIDAQTVDMSGNVDAATIAGVQNHARADEFNTDLPQPAGESGAPSSGPGGVPGAAGVASSAAGGAGCLGGGLSISGLIAGTGIGQALGGLGTAALSGAISGALSGGGLQGIMGGALGGLGGALGNSIGSALGSSLGGQLASSLGGQLGSALGGALGRIAAGANPLQALSGAAFGALSQMGAGLIPGLSNVLPAALQSAAVGGLQSVLGAVATGQKPSVSMALVGGLSGLIANTANNMIGNTTYSAYNGPQVAGAITSILSGVGVNQLTSGQINLAKYANLIQVASAVTSNNRNMVASISEAMSTSFGNGVGGQGSATRNMQDAMTFSVSTLGQNINAVSADFIAMGKWNTSNLMRLMQPGNVASQILFQGLGDDTGLIDILTANNIPLAGLDNPVYDRVTLAVLSTITDSAVINTIKSAFGMTTKKFTKLSDLCDITIMLPNCYANLPVKNFRELGVQLAVIGISIASTMRDIGIAFSKLETASDLNHITQVAQPFPPALGNTVMQFYGYGGGPMGEQTMADLIGTAAGYVHEHTVPVIVSANKKIMDHAEAATLVDLTKKLSDTAAGKYTILSIPGDSQSGIPDTPGTIDIPGVGSFSTLDDAIYAFIPLIEAEHQKLLNSTDPILTDEILKLNTAWNASCAQIIRENNNLAANQIDIFAPDVTGMQTGMMFAQSLDYLGTQTGYGQAAHYLERVASNDIYGDAIKYTMRQARNAQALQGLGIDIEKYKLPQSQYYRNPEGFYESLYTAQMPSIPRMQRSQIYPRTATDTYIFNRTQALTAMGMADMPLLNNQKDEIYYDSLWADKEPTVLDNIGQNVVKNVINNSISVKFPNITITAKNGVTFNFATIQPTGLLLTNNSQFLATMMSLVNRALYGDLITTKNDNPFNTDKMVYGLLELLAQVSPNNISALLQTVTGGIIAGDLLYLLQQIYAAGAVGGLAGIDPAMFTSIQTRRNLFDTSMDRNDPAAWGNTGPDAKPR
jgi:GH24 family phage-related lysozyme (muramidase)